MRHQFNQSETDAVTKGHPARSRRVVLRLPRFISRRLSRDDGGSAAIEFAFIAPVFFFLMFVIAETALVFIAEQVLNNAVFETARLIRTGQAQDAKMTDATFKTEICNRVSVFINCQSSNFYLDVKSYATFGAMNITNPLKPDDTFNTPAAFQFGTPNQIVVVRAYYQWPTNEIFGSLSLKNLSNGRRLIGSFAAFCNEPYQSTAAGGCGG
jgi:Flp pilus assembly protein TadG